MSRIRIYLALTVVAGVIAGVWFAATEEVASGATEPGAYDLFLVVTVGLAMTGTLIACVVFEVARWTWTLLRDDS